MTAFTTVPFFVWPSGAASFTLAVTTSPKPARRPVAPPSGSIICSLRAPLLSATSSMLRIITVIRFLRAKHPVAGFQMPAIQDARLLLLDPGSHFRHLRSFPHDFLEPPALQFRKRPRFLQANNIADVCFVFLVVCVKLFGLR